MSVESEAQAVGSYWDGHPKPPPEPATAEQQAAYDQQMAQWESKFPGGTPPDPPTPPTVPGPPTPGAGMPAARVGDLCAHGGVITGPGSLTVKIGGLPAARVTDIAACPMFNGVVPHATGTILKGSNSVLIDFLPAARVSDTIGPPATCAGNAIAMGFPQVLIGDSGGGGGGGGGGGSGGGPAPETPGNTPPPQNQNPPPIDPTQIAAAAVSAANQAAAAAAAALTQLCSAQQSQSPEAETTGAATEYKEEV